MSTRKQRVITQKNIEEAMALNALRNGSESLSARKKAAKEGFNSELFYGWSNRRRPPLVTRGRIQNFGVGWEGNADAWPSTQPRNIPPELLGRPSSWYGVKPYGRTRKNLSAMNAAADTTGIGRLKSRLFKPSFNGMMAKVNPTFYSIVGESPQGTMVHRMQTRPILPVEAEFRQYIHDIAHPRPRVPVKGRRGAITESVKRRIQAEAAREQSFLEAAAEELYKAPSVANLIEKYRSKK